MKIITEYIYPPIPDRRWDWQAIFEDYDGAPDSHHPMGFGGTEEAAIKDLMNQVRCNDCDDRCWKAPEGWICSEDCELRSEVSNAKKESE